jgi:hypothetical protein
MHFLHCLRIRAVILVSLVPLSTALFASAALAQGITATAKTSSSATPPDVAAMKRRVDELERRVLELEKEKAEQIEADKSDDAADKKLEQRLAAVETAVRDEAARDRPAQHAESSKTLGPQTVRAPFVVVDDDGVELAKIGRSPVTGGAGFRLGDAKGTSVVLSATRDEAAVQFIDSKNSVAIGIESNPSHVGMFTKGPNGQSWIGSTNEKVMVVQVINKSGYPVAEMRDLPVSQSGQMSIANANGNKLMFVGETEKGVGILRLGPSGYGVAPSMQNQGLPASALIGKKE